jgi:hypothetical protein
MLRPEPRRIDDELLPAGKIAAVRDREEGNPVKLHTLDPGIGIEDDVEEEVRAFVDAESNRRTGCEATY